MKIAESVKSIISGANSASAQNSHPSSKVIDGICVDTQVLSELEKWRYCKFTKENSFAKFVTVLKQLNITGKEMEYSNGTIHFGGKDIRLVSLKRDSARDHAPHIEILENSTITEYSVTYENEQLGLQIEYITKSNSVFELRFQYPTQFNCSVAEITFTEAETWKLRIYPKIETFDVETLSAFEETLFGIDSLYHITPADIYRKHQDCLKTSSINFSLFNKMLWSISITNGVCTSFMEYDSQNKTRWELFCNDFSNPNETLRYEYMKTASTNGHPHIEEEMHFLNDSFKFQTNAADPVKRLMECMEELKKHAEKAKKAI